MTHEALRQPEAAYELDRDTEVFPRTDDPSVFDTALSANWTIGMGVNGGYLLALAARALGSALPHPDPFSITAHYLTASQPGPATVRTEVLRTGRTLSTGTARIMQTGEDGKPVPRVHVTASYGDLDTLPGDVRTTARPPVMPSPDECRLQTGPKWQDSFMLRLEERIDPATAGWLSGNPSGNGEMRAWWRLADGRAPDPLALLLAVDALPPTAFDIGLRGWVPTVELTVHVRAKPVPGWLRVSVVTRNLAGGFLEEDCEVWDEADRLVAQSRQLAKVRLPKPS